VDQKVERQPHLEAEASQPVEVEQQRRLGQEVVLQLALEHRHLL